MVIFSVTMSHSHIKLISRESQTSITQYHLRMSCHRTCVRRAFSSPGMIWSPVAARDLNTSSRHVTPMPPPPNIPSRIQGSPFRFYCSEFHFLTKIWLSYFWIWNRNHPLSEPKFAFRWVAKTGKNTEISVFPTEMVNPARISAPPFSRFPRFPKP